MKTVTILCSTPGFRRLGIAHPASETYEGGRWSDAQIELLKSDPMFRIVETEQYGAPIPNVAIAGVGGSYDTLATAMHGEASISERYEGHRLRELMIQSGLIAAGDEIFRRGREGEPEFVRLYFPGEVPERREYGIDQNSTQAPHHSAVVDAIDPPAGTLAVTIDAARLAGGVREPAAVAPGADRSDAVQDNGAGPAINDLGAKPLGIGEAAAGQTGSGVRQPVFDDGRIQSIRGALKDFAPDEDFTKAANLRRLTTTLKFKPTPEEIVAARVETVLPEATFKT